MKRKKTAIRFIVGQNVRKHHIFRSYDQQWGKVQEDVVPTWLQNVPIKKLERIHRQIARFITGNLKSREGCVSKIHNKLEQQDLQTRLTGKKKLISVQSCSGADPCYH